MGALTDRQDAFGHGIYDHHRGEEGCEIAERDDGHLDVSGGPKAYFRPYAEWPGYEREAIALARGRVLDVGCGAGRVALHLQEHGLAVVAIDNSPLAIKTCRLRGVRQARVLPFERISPRLGRFDTVVMYGNNFGLLGSFRRARTLLRRLHRMTSAEARIIASTFDPYKTNEPFHRAYHRRNKARGRMGGQVRIRIRYRAYATPWFDCLYVSQRELRAVLAGTGWRAARFFEAGGGRYIAVLEKG